MTIRLGSKADGDDFFDRVTERENLWRYLEDNHIVLSGPRRLGKTSILQRLSEEAQAKGLLAKLIDVEGVDTAEGFIAEIERAFPDGRIAAHVAAAKDRVAGWFDRIRKVEVKLPGGVGGGLELQGLPDASWRDAASRLQIRLSTQPVLILIDEFSVFLEKMLAKDTNETERLLGWLRLWRQQSGLACRFLFSGSISLNALLVKHGMTTRFNDCHDFRLGPFTRKAALDMLAEQVRRSGWHADSATLDSLCARVGWLSPFYLNLLLDSTMNAARDRIEESGLDERQLCAADVDDAYDRLLATRSRFIHWHQRLGRDLDPPQLALTLKVLAAVATSEQGLMRRQLLARLQRVEADLDRRAERLEDALLVLSEDGYLDTEGDRIRFLSFLLRDYWRRNHAR